MTTPTPTTVQVKLQLRADTAANWSSVNPVLLNNELALETDTKKLKVGNGSTAWNSLAYFPFVVSGGTVLGNLEIGTTGTLTFEGSSADNFETTLGVVNPTADRTINLPNQSGTVIVSGNASIVDADISASAEIAVSKLADGAARQLLQTDAAGTGVEWASNIDIPGTLDVTSAATFDSSVTIAGDLTVNGTTTNINTQNLVVEDKNVILGDVATPSDTTADGGGITLKGATDKTMTWVDATDAWTLSEHVNIASGKEYRIAGTKVLDATSIGSSVLITSANITDGTIVNGDINASAAIAGTKISPDFGSQNVTTTGSSTAASFIPNSSTVPSNGVYLSGTNTVAVATNSTGRLFVDPSGKVLVGTNTSRSIGGAERLVQIEGTSASSTNLSITRNSNDSSQPSINFAKTRGTSNGSLNAVLANDNLGGIIFTGADGSSILNGAYIESRAESNASAGFLPCFISVGTGGSERLRITSDGKLGLGTSSPQTGILDLTRTGTAGTVSSYRQLRIGVDANNNYSGFIGYGSAAGSATGLIIESLDNGLASQTLINPSGGNVGIGTTGPQAVLHVEKNQAAETGLFINNSDAGGYPALRLGPSDRATNGDHLIYGGVNLGLRSKTGAPITFEPAGSEAARLDSSGRLLVGTSSPGNLRLNQKLAVVSTGSGSIGGASLTSYSGTNGGDAPVLDFQRSVGTADGSFTEVTTNYALGYIVFRGADGVGWSDAAQISAEADGDWTTSGDTTDSPGRLVFSTTLDGTSSPTEALRITNDRVIAYNQPNVTSKSAGATLTIAELKTGIIHYNGAAATLTLPTGTLSEGGFSGIYTNMTFEWSVVNTGFGTCTIGAGTAHTIVGGITVVAGASGRFASRRTAANTFVTYRLS